MASELSSQGLPVEFVDLDRFVSRWDLPDRDARCRARLGSRFEALQEFYDAIVPRFGAILTYLDRFPLGKLPPEGLLLQRLVFALADMKLSVEVFGSPCDEDGWDPFRVRLGSPAAYQS